MPSVDSGSLTPPSSSSAAAEVPCWWREVLRETGRLGWDGDEEPTVHIVDVHSLTFFRSWENPKRVNLFSLGELPQIHPFWIFTLFGVNFGLVVDISEG